MAERKVAGRYRLLEHIGEGGMGIVWRAHDELLDRVVAVKEVRYQGIDETARADLNRRTIREARTAGRLDHPSVVIVHDVVEEEGRPWIVMQMIRSRSLGEIVRADGPLSPERVASVGLHVLGALRAAHAEGVLHRDVKPENVLLADDGRVVLTDFGIASMTQETGITRTGAMVGTPAFLPPERLHDLPATPESDLWSLGATLYAALEGRPPFERATAAATMMAVLNGEPSPMTHSGPLVSAILGLMAKDPAARMAADQAEALLGRASSGDTPGRVPSPGPGAGRGPLPGPASGFAHRSTPPRDGATRHESPVYGPPPGDPRHPGGPAYGRPPGEAALPGHDRHPSGPPHGYRTAQDLPAPYTAQPPLTGQAPPPGQREYGSPWPPTGLPHTGPSHAGSPHAGRPSYQDAAPGVWQPGHGSGNGFEPHPAGPGRPPYTHPGQGAYGTESQGLLPVYEHPTGTGGEPPARRTGAGRVALLAGVPALVVAVGVGGWLVVRNQDADPGRPEVTAPITASPPATARPDDTAKPPTVTPPATPPVTPPPATEIPSGWRLHRDPMGFSVAVPEEWQVKRFSGRDRVEFRAPGSRAFLWIESTDDPERNPVRHWEKVERAGTADDVWPGYERVRITSLRYRGVPAADWEFTYLKNGGRTHVLDRGFRTLAGRPYAIYWESPESQWDGGSAFAVFTRTFRP